MSKLSLGERMKEYYEYPFSARLPRRMPIIIRLDGKAFHTYTRGMNKPFDDDFIQCMMQTSLYLCRNIATCQIGYSQSDEISLLLHPYKHLDTQAWLGGRIQKMASISASMASCKMSSLYPNKEFGIFDARVFVLPESEVCNYFIWRQQDAERNSLNLLAQSHYSHKQLLGKKSADLHEMLYQKGDNWSKLETHKKRGFCVVKEGVDREIPRFGNERDYIETYLDAEK